MQRANQAILRNVRVLDFTWVLAGPYTTRLLADFGAEVIKVQPLLPEATDQYSRGYYNTWNRNKLGITLDLTQPEGIELVKKLVKICDVVVENFSPRVMENWGLDYPKLKEIKPEIIMVSLSLMGHDGPWRDYVGFGPTAQAFSGITYLTGYPGQPPSGIGFSYADHVAALYASLALLGALERRRKTGKSQYIDLSETEATVSSLPNSIIDYTGGRLEAQPMGNSSEQAAPHGVYPCLGKDRWCAIAVTTEKEWQGFKCALGNPAWAEHARFATLSDRIKNMEGLDSLAQGWTMQHTAEDVMSVLQREGVPAGVVQNAGGLARDPQLRSREFFVKLPSGRDDNDSLNKNADTSGSQQYPFHNESIADASPIRLSEIPAQYRWVAPKLGQDNDYVFRQLLGLSENEINRLESQKVI